MTPPNEVKYVSFGGAQVPEGCKRQVINQNSKQMYCVWLQDGDKEGKVVYPKQQTKPSNESVYTKTWYTQQGCIGKPRVFSELCSSSDFNNEKLSAEYREHHPKNNEFASTYTSLDGRYASITRYEDIGHITKYEKYEKQPLDTTPRIEITTDKGMIYDTNNIKISNMNGANITGTAQEDNITLEHSDNCYVDVANANNNIFVSDNVRDVNGKNNKIKLGDNDTLEKVQHDYDKNTERTNTYKH